MEKGKFDPTKIQVLRMLPVDIKQSLTKEEVMAFLNDQEWPESLQEKLKDYIVD